MYIFQVFDDINMYRWSKSIFLSPTHLIIVYLVIIAVYTTASVFHITYFVHTTDNYIVLKKLSGASNFPASK